jgi:hypothetical protein
VRNLRTIAAAGLLAVASLGLTAGGVAAYGKADEPLAQVEWSANCNNPAFELCQQVGLGGVWLWIEIDADGTADVAGAGCGHVKGVGGGGGPIRGEFDWTWSPVPIGFPASFSPDIDPAGYYVIQIDPTFVVSFNVTHGHYSAHPAPAVALELQIAP